MAVEIKLPRVKTHEQRKQWIDLLETVVQYHLDMAENFKIAEEDANMHKIHTGWAQSILEAIWLVQMWEIDGEADLEENEGFEMVLPTDLEE
tara:strand:+ start:81 stop:356 length:276 start_codon:yes stop_codon:yes gene_type:complete